MGLEGLVTVEKIRAAINASLSGLSNSNATITITKNDGTTNTITINNVANATTATKLGSSTVGSGVKAIYLNEGTATASNSTVGNSNTPVYLNNGTFTACSSSIGSNLTTYTSLEQIGITPGEETFASIHSALPINSVLEYYVYVDGNFNDEFYPVSNYYGVLQAVKLNDTKTVFSFYAHNVISGNEFSELYLSAYHSSFADTTVWKKVALDSDLTNLSNSVVKSVNGIKPTNGNVTIDIPKPVIASEAEAKAGTNNTKFMTPLRVAQALAANLAANNGGIVSANLAQNGYVKFANGFIVQWGRTAEGNNLTTQYPIAFTSFCILGVAMCSSNAYAAESVFRNGFGYTAKSLTSWTFRGVTGDAAYYCDYIAVGK